jgi:hypothetical protein
MEITEMMKRYEETTYLDDDPQALIQIIEYLKDCVQGYKAKASAYDRLMSGGRKTLKEWANFLGKCFAVDPDGFGYSFGSKPIIKDEHWWPDGDRIAYSAIRPDLIDFNGDWKDSLTLPDGWEEK